MRVNKTQKSLTCHPSRVELKMRIHEKLRIEFGGTSLMLDHSSPNGEPIFLSHAHSDHAVKKGRIITTPETARLIDVRYNARGADAVIYGKSVKVADMEVTLFPSGHILGSAQILIKTRETSLLYSGDIKLRPGYSAQPIQVPQAENLIVEATFGSHMFQWPRRETIEERIVEFAEDGKRFGFTACYMAYSLGKAQELLMILARAGIRAYVSESVFEMCKVYEEFGVRFGDYRLYRDEPEIDGVLVIPPQKAHHLELKKAQFALVSGWAVSQRRTEVPGIPLSDHADFGELLRYVDRVKPKKVWTNHGFARDLASALRHRGYDAQVLPEKDEERQLELVVA